MDFFLWKFPMYKRKQPFPVIFAGLFFRFFFSTLNSSEPVWTSLLHFFLFGLGSSWQQATAAAKLKVQSPAVTDVLSFMGYEPPFEVKMTDQDDKKKDERCAVLEIVHARPAIVKFRPCGIGLAFLAGQCRARLVFSSAKFCLYSVFVAFRYWKGPRVNKTPFVNKGGGR